MTFDDLQHCVHEDIIIPNDDPAVIAAEVSQLLNGLKPEYTGSPKTSPRAFEFAFKDGDMVEAVRQLGAVLEPMIDWLPAARRQLPFIAARRADEISVEL